MPTQENQYLNIFTVILMKLLLKLCIKRLCYYFTHNKCSCFGGEWGKLNKIFVRNLYFQLFTCFRIYSYMVTSINIPPPCNITKRGEKNIQ